MKTIYLSGGISPWRDLVKTLLGEKVDMTEVILIDPFKASRQHAISSFTLDDLNHIMNSDVVLGYLDYHIFDGMALEFGFAAGMEIPCVLVVDGQPRVPSMMAGVSKAVYLSLEPALDYIVQRIFPEIDKKHADDQWFKDLFAEDRKSIRERLDVLENKVSQLLPDLN